MGVCNWIEFPLLIIFVCVVSGQFLTLYPFGEVTFASWLELVWGFKSFWGDRKCSLENTGLIFFFSLWIMSLVHQTAFWPLTLPEQSSVQLYFVSNCRCLFAIWVSLFVCLFWICLFINDLWNFKPNRIQRNSWFSKLLLLFCIQKAILPLFLEVKYVTAVE